MRIIYVSASAVRSGGSSKAKEALAVLAPMPGSTRAAGPILIAVDSAVAATERDAALSAWGAGAPEPIDARAMVSRDAAGAVDVEATRRLCAAAAPGLPAEAAASCGAEEAAVLALCLGAELVALTGTRGAFQCDPSVVPEAEEIAELSFEEAAELSRFAASGLDQEIVGQLARFRAQATLIPVAGPAGGSCDDGEAAEGPRGALAQAAAAKPCRGTRVRESSEEAGGPVKAIAAQLGVSMVSISGTCLPGTVGVAARLFDAVGKAGVSLLLITQSSTEYSISFCVETASAAKASAAIEREFARELAARTIDPVSVQDGLAIMTLIGDGMRRTKGIAGRCFTQLARADVNIVAIAQGSSERAISAVISSDRVERGVRMAYLAFFDTTMPIDIVMVGCGNVGSALLSQITLQAAKLEGHGVGARLVAVTNSKRMAVDKAGLDLGSWRAALAEKSRPLDLPALIALGPELVNPVLVDCTASDQMPRMYPDFMLAGFHVVTPNKRGNTGSMAQYKALRTIAIRHRRRYLYETTVGAGLPVIENLQNLLHAGDRLDSFGGILSGSLSYLFGRLEEGLSFSAAVREAMDKGFTEPDPRDDLSGTDVARKVLILARESGLSMELSDIELCGLIPPEYMALGKAEFVERMGELDAAFEKLKSDAAAEGKVLRLVGSIREGRGKVSLEAVGSKDPLYWVKGGENALAFTTRYYSPVPLLLRGYGAGADVTAAGIFADILRTLNWIREA